MKTHLQLATQVYADLTLATQVGNLRHIGIQMHPFTGLDAYGRARFQMAIPMKAPAFSEWGAQIFSVVIPSDAMGNRHYLGESASVVEIAPLRYGGELFASPYFAEEKGEGGTVHPLLRDDQVVRFGYPKQMADFHEWILAFCVLGSQGESLVR
tara:strand:- start:108 stop:569 length:462 start_codon:yes stop_codon:yes gene_type:complete